MRSRSLALLPRLAAVAMATASAGALATTAATAAPRPAKLTGTSSTLAGNVVTVLWAAKPTGRVQVAVRRPVSGKRRTTTRSFKASAGQANVTLRGAAPTPATVRVRLRRCATSARCGAWTRWATPGAATGSTPAAPTPTPKPAANGPAANAPVGSLAPGTTTPVTTAPGDGPTIAGCPQMPSGWALNQRVDSLPVAAASDAYVRFLGAGRNLHPDFSGGPYDYGIPFRVVPENEPLVRIDLGIYADESDPGPYPIPLDTPVEGGPSAPESADRHVLVAQQGTCKLYELGNAIPQASSWKASVGAIFNLQTGAPRPTGWTSVDAAGLPILPLLARYDEAASGRIKHAIRMTSHGIADAYIPPASHFAPTSNDPNAPPMGQRFRLKASYDLSRLSGPAKVIAQAMKEYGLVLADTGSDWFVTGAPDRRWDEDNLSQLKGIPGSAFEAVDSGPIVRR